MKKMNLTKRIIATCLVCLLCLSSLTACANDDSKNKSDVPMTVADSFNDGTEVVFDLGESQISYGKLLYFISYYELYGKRMKEYYETSMGYQGNYWDEMIDETQTEADHYKDLVYQTTLYYEVLKNEALKKGYTLTEEDLVDSKKYAEESIAVFTDAQIKKSGITLEGLIAARNTMTIAGKYIDDVKEEAKEKPELKIALDTLKRENYESDEQYQEGIDKSVESFCNGYINNMLSDLMEELNIVPVGDIWENVKIGTVTLE